MVYVISSLFWLLFYFYFIFMLFSFLFLFLIIFSKKNQTKTQKQKKAAIFFSFMFFKRKNLSFWAKKSKNMAFLCFLGLIWVHLYFICIFYFYFNLIWFVCVFWGYSSLFSQKILFLFGRKRHKNVAFHRFFLLIWDHFRV